MKLHLGENIRENRRRMGLTQEQLADRLGVSFQSVSRWENGTTYPDMEKLPELAKLFDITTDALLGFVKKEEKIPIDDLDRMYMEAVGREDWEECADIIRRIRHEYLDELDKGLRSVVRYASVDDNYKKEIIKNELRLLAETYLEKGSNGLTRTDMIHLINEIEDEDKIGDFLGKYATDGIGVDKFELLERRYWILKDHEKHTRYSFHNKIRTLEKFLFPLFVNRNEGNAEKWIESTKARIAVLNSLCGITPDDKHPITGDGVIDLFTLRRVRIGSEYVTQLCGCGQYEEAITALEDIAECFEKLNAIPNGEKILNRCPIFEGIEAFKSCGYNAETDMIGYINYEPVRKRDVYDYRLDIRYFDNLWTEQEIRWFTKANFKSVRQDTKWLDPIRDNPAYVEAVRRMTDACRANHRKDDYGFREDMTWLESYNKGRKAVGKDEVKPSH